MRSLTPSEAEHVPALLERAEDLIREKVPEFTGKTEVGSELFNEQFRKAVVAISADAVARVLRNPGAFRQETEGNYSYTLDKQVASGMLSIEESEWERLGVLDEAEFGTVNVAYDGYAAKRFKNARPDLVFQYGWPGDKPGMSERII